MTDHSQMKLGKRAARRDSRTLKLARYLATPLPTPPATVDYSMGISDWSVMLNDQLGCCTISAVGHAIQAWTRNALGRELTVQDSTILEYYEKWDGYNPADPATDQGGVELDVLNDWRQQGFDGQTLSAFVAIDLANAIATNGSSPNGSGANLVETALWLFGGIYIGLELPLTAQTQDIWDVDSSAASDKSEPGSWGGHAVYVVGYEIQGSGIKIQNSRFKAPESAAAVADPSAGGHTTAAASGLVSPCPVSGIPSPGFLTCVTWGRLKKMTWAWFEKYCSEAYALISTDWLKTNGVAPSGFDLAALQKDLAAVTA